MSDSERFREFSINPITVKKDWNLILSKKVETGCSTIFKFDNVIDPQVCDRLVDFMLSVTNSNQNLNLNLMPWQDNDSYDWNKLPSDYLFAKVESYRQLVTELVSFCYQEEVYPHFTDLVLWRTGRKMDRHRDDGYSDAEVYMRQRSYTTMTYLNDNYSGGETFITSEHGDYISEPKKGSIVILKSGPENAHGVNPVISGTRVTLPIWFTKKIENIEKYDVR